MGRTPLLLAATLCATLTLVGCSGSDEAEDQARDLVTFGGPQGWVATPDDARSLPDNFHPGTVDDVPVTFESGDQPVGVHVVWTTSVDADDATQRCDELAAWMARAADEWPGDGSLDVDGLTSSCEHAYAGPSASIVHSAAGSAHGASGRVTYSAVAGAASDGHDELTATLAFNADV